MITHTKGQFFAVTLIVIIGLTVFIALRTNMEKLERSVDYYYDETRYADLFVELVKIPKNKILMLYNIEGVSEVEGRIVFDVPLNVDNADEKVNVRVISVDPSNDQINRIYLREGGLIKDQNRDAMVIEKFAYAREVMIGDTINPQIGGRHFNLNVVARVSTPEYIYLNEEAQTFFSNPLKFGVLFVSEQFAENSFGFKGYYNQVLIKVKDPNESERILDEVEKALEKYGIKNIYERKNQTSARMVSLMIKVNKELSKVIPFFYLGSAAIIIAIIIGRIVKNHRVAIGILKAMGYSNGAILMHYTKYSFFIGILGGGLGIVAGIRASTFIVQIYTRVFIDIPVIPEQIFPGQIILGILVTSAFTISSGLWGSRSILRITPAESMRPEAPKLGKRIFLDRVKVVWKRVSFSWKVVLRNMFRNKRRIIFVASGVAMVYAMLTIPIFMSNAFDNIIISQFGEFQNMDYVVNFRKPINENNLHGIRSLLNIEDIEGKIEIPCELTYGWRGKVTNVIGLESDTVFYDFRNQDGDRVKVPERGIALTTGLAYLMGLEKGDYVTMKSFIPGRGTITVEVKEIIEQKLGINGYMNIDYMRDQLVDDEMITGAMMNTKANLKEELETMKNVSSVKSLKDMKAVFEEFLVLTTAYRRVIMFFASTLGFAIVYNTTVMSINERVLEFSSLRVMGFGKNEIFALIFRENLIIGILGIIGGIPLGRLFIFILTGFFKTELYYFVPQLTMASYIKAGLFTILFGLLAQLAAYGKIQRLNFIDALKNRTT